MSRIITDQDVLQNAPGSELLASPMRVVAVDLPNDRVWLSALRRVHPKKPSRMRTYFRAPKAYVLSEIEEHLRRFKLITSKAAMRHVLNLSDEDIKASARTTRERKQFEKMLADRNQRWRVILPILSGSKTSEKVRTFLEIISDPALTATIKARAESLGKPVSTIYSLLNQYWALGSRPNSLCTNLWRCGCPGQEKTQNTKLGREGRLFIARLADRGCQLMEEDKRKLAWGYTLVNTQTTANDAYHLVSGVFWADHSVNAEGKPTATLWPKDRRPTMAQFMYWGRKLNDGKSVRRLVLGEAKWDVKAGTRGGSLQDQTTAIGQVAYFDGTSTDVYLTSIRSRLKKLPPMVRLILKEARSEVIYGLYCGWEPPSPRTAMLAIQHGSESKVAFCRRFGIDIQEEDWPSLLAFTVFADNGELKAEKITEAEQQFGYSVEYAQAMRGDKKGGIESQHHSDHKMLDHKVPGTTYGRRRQRGEKNPVREALWNYYEYMHELIEAILAHNNKEAMDLAPLAMLQEEPNLCPTRLNIFKWLRKKGLTSELSCDPEAMRGFLLPDHHAVIRKNGIYLMAEIHGRLQVIPKLRYTSKELVATGVLSRVKLARREERTRIKLRDDNLTTAWLPSRNGMIPLQLASRDTLLRERTCLREWCIWLEDLTLQRDLRRGGDEQSHLSRLLHRGQTTEAARAEQAAEMAKLPKRPSTAQQKNDLRANRDLERILLAQEEMPIPEPTAAPAAQDLPPPSGTSASARAMQKYQQNKETRHVHQG